MDSVIPVLTVRRAPCRLEHLLTRGLGVEPGARCGWPSAPLRRRSFSWWPEPSVTRSAGTIGSSPTPPGPAASSGGRSARLIALLAQLDERRLYLGEGCSSLFTYCTQVLHLSEHAAYGRIEAARAARRFPLILDLLTDGSVTLTTITLLSAHLTPDNHVDLLNEARHKSKRDVEHLVARLRPQAAVPAEVRKLPGPKAVPDSLSARRQASLSAESIPVAVTAPPPPPRPAIVAPLDPERYKVQFTVSHETHDKLRRAQDLLRHSIPNGDPAAIFDRALTLLLAISAPAELAARAARARAPVAAGSRHIPAAVRREVWKRDGGQCAFVGTQGRCAERGFLEFHHVRPYADGGATVVENLELRCRAHNVHEAEKYFGESTAAAGARAFRTCLRVGASVLTGFDVRRPPALADPRSAQR